MDHAVGELGAVQLRPRPFHAAVRGAFEEIDAVLARETLEVVIGEDQRLIDQPVDHQPVVLLGQFDGPGMMTLEADAVRRDNAVKLVNRREVDRGCGFGGQPGHAAPDHVALEFDRRAIGVNVDPVAQMGRPGLHFGDQRIGGGLRYRARGNQCRRRQRASGGKAAGQEAPATSVLRRCSSVRPVGHVEPHGWIEEWTGTPLRCR